MQALGLKLQVGCVYFWRALDPGVGIYIFNFSIHAKMQNCFSVTQPEQQQAGVETNIFRTQAVRQTAADLQCKLEFIVIGKPRKAGRAFAKLDKSRRAEPSKRQMQNQMMNGDCAH